MEKAGMSSEKISEALSFYQKYFQDNLVHITQHPDTLIGQSDDKVLAHCNWMAINAQKFLLQGRREKAMRWLCFIQGCVFTLRRNSISALKDQNRPDPA